MLGYVLVVTSLVCVTQIESWPFTNWALVHNLAPTAMGSWFLEGLDAGGRAYRIDGRVLQPMGPEEFGTALIPKLHKLGPAQREQVAGFLLQRAELARLRLREGRGFAANEWLLGRLAAPFHFHQDRLWRTAADVPASSFVGLRIWQLKWNVEERLLDERRVERRLLLEFPPSRPSS